MSQMGLWCALVYLPPYHLDPKELDSSIIIGRASHWTCEVVGSFPTQVPGFFFLGKGFGGLDTSATVNAIFMVLS